MERTLSFLLLAGMAVVHANAQTSGALTVQASTTHAVCGSPTGSILISAWGGTWPYTYNWTPTPPNGQGTTMLADVPPGTWTITVTDNAGGTASLDVTVLQTPDLFPAITPLWPAWSCDGTCTGSWYYFQPLGGVSPHTVSFDIPGPTGSATPNGFVFNGLCTGESYTITVSDANGCTGTIAPLEVVGPMNPELLDTQVTGSCADGSTGSFTLTFSVADTIWVTGPNGTYFSGSSNPFTLNDLPPGMYTIAVAAGQNITSPPGGSTGYCDASFQVEVPVSTDPCGTVSGVVYADLDGDCAQSGNDIGIPYQVLTIQPDDHYTLTDANGLYSTELFHGSYALDPTIANYTVICPDPVPVVFTLDAATPSFTVDAAQDPINGPDVSVFLNAGVHRPGFPVTYQVTVHNEGPWPFTDLGLLLEYDPLLSFVSATGSPSAPNAGELEWIVPAVGGFSTEQFDVVFSLPADPGLLGTVITATTTVTPIPADAVPANDMYDITRVVVNSYDPNDKHAITSSRASEIYYFLDLDAHVDYTIRFQNTGTAEAIDVVVTDTISTQFDLHSLEILAASHPFVPSLHDGRVLRFAFAGIMLPDSTSNEPGSHGFVSFRLKPVNGLSAGQSLTNAADIFFDINDPVRTNTSVLQTEYSVGMSEVAGTISSVRPNPATDQLAYDGPQLPASLEVLAMDGRAALVAGARTNRLDVSTLRSGAYLLKVSLPGGTIEHHRFIKH